MPRQKLAPEELSRRNVERVRRWREQNPEARRKEHLAKYGLTLEQYAALYSAQEGRCAICTAHHPRLSVDHDHETGEVRGLLCITCNGWLGFFEKYLDATKTYLEGGN